MLEISLNSPTPVYEQLMHAIRDKINDGSLPPGSRLPPIRSLAKQLDVAVNTVARAYQELEREFLIVSNGRKGSFVRERQVDHGETAGRALKVAVLELLKRGHDREDIERMFSKVLHQIFS